uniref:Uncharacterized protein n=1 Tax=Rhizophora mucronata TaxID=61149 RepID=A0A2P2LBS8_RHIMU
MHLFGHHKQVQVSPPNFYQQSIEQVMIGSFLTLQTSPLLLELTVGNVLLQLSLHPHLLPTGLVKDPKKFPVLPEELI